MSILIEGMEMPKNCHECPLLYVTSLCDGSKDCPLSPAPECEYERGEFDVLDLLSSAWHGKQYYFMQDNGAVYSRDSCKYMRLDDAISEFASRIGDDGSI